MENHIWGRQILLAFGFPAFDVAFDIALQQRRQQEIVPRAHVGSLLDSPGAKAQRGRNAAAPAF
jgi:hypothetical protein